MAGEVLSLTPQEAYSAMYAFLEAEWELTRSDELGSLLGDLSLLSDGSPTDPAVSEQWSRACQLAKAGKVDTHLHLGKQ